MEEDGFRNGLLECNGSFGSTVMANLDESEPVAKRKESRDFGRDLLALRRLEDLQWSESLC